MNLYYISQDDNSGYDTYDGAIVAARSAREARLIRPDGNNWEDPGHYAHSSWTPDPKKVDVKLIGKAEPRTKAGIILASFNAG